MRLRKIVIERIVRKSKVSIPVLTCPVQAGFPVHGEDWIEGRVDLNRFLAPQPKHTYLVPVFGNSMAEAGIRDGAQLIVDRSLQPKEGDMVVAAIDGELTVKRFRRIGEVWFLFPESSDYSPIQITNEIECRIWGVVTKILLDP